MKSGMLSAKDRILHIEHEIAALQAILCNLIGESQVHCQGSVNIKTKILYVPQVQKGTIYLLKFYKNVLFVSLCYII